ncbi:hypothetical protein L249_4249, partial [Ophiocordyceps polyrhachis-furcata BCC 54312]
MIMSNQGVDHVIEKKKTNHVMIGDLEEDFNVMDQPDDLTLRADRCDGCLVPRSIGCYDRYRYSAPIAVTIAVTSRFGRYDRYSPTVTQGVVAGLRPNWYNLFQPYKGQRFFGFIMGLRAQSPLNPIGIVIAARELGKSDFLSGVVAGLRSNWYNLFQVALQAYFLSV